MLTHLKFTRAYLITRSFTTTDHASWVGKFFECSILVISALSFCMVLDGARDRAQPIRYEGIGM